MSKIAKLIKHLLSRPPEARFEEISYVLKAFGYQEVRVKGSHHVFENDEGDVIVVPKKGGKKVKRTYIEVVIKLSSLRSLRLKYRAGYRPSTQRQSVASPAKQDDGAFAPFKRRLNALRSVG